MISAKQSYRLNVFFGNYHSRIKTDHMFLYYNAVKKTQLVQMNTDKPELMFQII